MKKLLMLSVALAMSAMPSMAQTSITGTVTDTKGTPMPGAKVQIKGTNENVLTNMDGTFSIVTNKNNPKLRAEYAGWDATTKTGKDGMVIKMGKSSWLHFKPETYQFFVGINAAFPETKVKFAAPGVMLGYVKNFGFYLKGQFNGTISDVDRWESGWFSGNEKRKYWSASAGPIARVYGPFYVYAGCGYEKRNIYWEYQDGEYWKTPDSYDGVMVDLGVMVRYSRFFVQAGVQQNASEFDSKRTKGNFGVGIYF